MGCCAATKIDALTPRKGVLAKKLSGPKNPESYIQEVVYLFGGFKVLQFDTKTKSITPVQIQPKISIPKRAQVEFLKEIERIALVGGEIDDKLTSKCYLFTPPNLSTPLQLPDFPFPIINTSLAFYNNKLYAVGGQVLLNDSSSVSNEVWYLELINHNEQDFKKGWRKACELPSKRRNANLVISNNKLYIFGGSSGEANLPQEIDSIDLNTDASIREPFTLPTGIEGGRLCWQGDNLLLVGGRSSIGTPISDVLLLNFELKAVLSVRGLIHPRDYCLMLPISFNEVFVFGGANSYSAEYREWNESIEDYCFEKTTIEGQRLIDNPTGYTSALPTFILESPNGDHLPHISPESRIIFGNEVDCFMIEVSKSLVPDFHYRPMILNQKSHQQSIRVGRDLVVLAGGIDTRSNEVSTQAAMFNIESREARSLHSLNNPRYSFSLVEVEGCLLAVGGKSSNNKSLRSVEILPNFSSSPNVKWKQIEPLRVERYGHVCWADENIVFVVGGKTKANEEPIDTIEMINTSTNTCSEYPFKIPFPVYKARLHLYKQWVYLIGGEDSKGNPSDSIYKLNRSRPEQMVLCRQMRLRRKNCIALSWENRIVIMGGCSGELIEVYNEETLNPEPHHFHSFWKSFYKQLECFTYDKTLQQCSSC